jgi:uncharacterized cupredoxin-like copper-binding protein
MTTKRTTARRATRTMTWALVAAATMLGGLAACSDDGGNSVNVALSEFEVNPDPIEMDAGEIEFVGDNIGGETHEMVVVKAANAADLPTDADGAVVEDELAEGAVIGEIEDIEAQSSKKVKLNLKSGDYVLFCNVTEKKADGTVESHFEEGMHAEFTVN